MASQKKEASYLNLPCSHRIISLWAHKNPKPRVDLIPIPTQHHHNYNIMNQINTQTSDNLAQIREILDLAIQELFWTKEGGSFILVKIHSSDYMQ